MEQNFNSVENQKIKGDFIAREVKTCFSYEMDDVLKINNTVHGDHNLPTWEDIENFYVYSCPECEVGQADESDFVPEIEPGKYKFVCPDCGHAFDEEPESEPQEIFEWWIVTEYLCKKLKAKGEPVMEWGNNYYWWRCCTGQAILLDCVISEICAEMEILDGQQYAWNK